MSSQTSRKKKRNARLYKKATETAKNISGMKRNQKIENNVPAIFCHVAGESCFGCRHITRVTSSEELGTMSKNNLRRIT